MTRVDRGERGFAVCLTMLAGYVDAIGYIATGGFFVSFMSGNTTRLGVGLASGAGPAFIAACLIAVFVCGVVLGSLVGRSAGHRRRLAVLLLMTVLLFVAAGLGALGWRWPCVATMALVMGVENTVFETAGEVRIGLTYMTGTLVKTGQHIATALTGGPAWGWTPHAAMWLAFAMGAVVGAVGYRWLGLGELWIAACGVLGLMLIVSRSRRGGEREQQCPV